MDKLEEHKQLVRASLLRIVDADDYISKGYLDSVKEFIRVCLLENLRQILKIELEI